MAFASVATNLVPGDTNYTIIGTDQGETIVGTPGDDVICALGGDDEIEAGPGDDVVLGGPGIDIVYGGSGFDTLSYADSAGPITGALDGNFTGEGTDHPDSIENVIGSPFADRLDGDNGPNTIEGGGDDLLFTGPGIDDDVADGSAGSDTVSFLTASAAVTVHLPSASVAGQGNGELASVEHVVGSHFADTITGDAAANGLAGASGNDRLFGGPGDDTLDGGPGTDQCYQGPGAGGSVACEA